MAVMSFRGAGREAMDIHVDLLTGLPERRFFWQLVDEKLADSWWMKSWQSTARVPACSR